MVLCFCGDQLLTLFEIITGIDASLWLYYGESFRPGPPGYNYCNLILLSLHSKQDVAVGIA
jgi:hypothetical protein